MRKNHGIMVGMSNEFIKKTLAKALIVTAFADEGGTDKVDEPIQTPTINYEDLIAKARKEEKDKQYKTIEKLKENVSTLTEQHNQDLLAKADLEKQLQEAKDKLASSGKDDSEEVKTLKSSIETLEKEKEDLNKKIKGFESQTPVSREEVEAEVRAELEKEYEVKTYKVTKMAEHKDDILVPELVFGSTKEEIDASIQKALERSAEIKKSLGVSETPNKRTPNSATNPSVSNIQDKGVSLEKLATMDVSSPEYAQLRKQLGLR